MKQLMIIIGLMFTFAVANAQVANTPTVEKPTNQQKAHNQALKMQKGFALTDEQTKKIEAIQLSRMDEIAAIKSASNLTDDVKQTRIKAVHDAKDLELSAILTPDQYAQFLAQREEIRARKQAAH